jgi:ATP-binding cassette subfamily F protein uup
VLDEPTNDLDLPSLRMLEEALADFDGSVICVSHDRYFLDRICDQIIAFEENGVVVQPGNYSYYLEKRQAREAAERIQAQTAARDAAARQKSAAPSARPRKITLKEKTELEGIESVILSAEQEVEAIEIQLHDPDFQATRFAEIPALVEKLDVAKAKVAHLYNRWEELEKLRAELEGG